MAPGRSRGPPWREVKAYAAGALSGAVACTEWRFAPKRQSTDVPASRSCVELSGDFLLCPLRFDLDLARLGLFGDRDAQRQDTCVVAGLDMFGVQGVAKDQLAAEDAARPFRGDQLDVLARRVRAFGPHR